MGIEYKATSGNEFGSDNWEYLKFNWIFKIWQLNCIFKVCETITEFILLEEVYFWWTGNNPYIHEVWLIRNIRSLLQFWECGRMGMV